MKICLKCRRKLFDTDEICDKCKSSFLMDSIRFKELYDEFKNADDDMQIMLRQKPEYKELCEYVFPPVSKPTVAQRQEQSRLDKQKKINKEEQDRQYRLEHAHHTVSSEKIFTLPTCPYCKSTDLKKITTAGRLVSLSIFGLASGKIGKQWHCNNCKSDF